ncbi:hypothetical protein CLAIMM_08902 [Cladophialophora immunda]|nr:hypothetical protein CLAIMM_08902 [Cladophialophora immunda]
MFSCSNQPRGCRGRCDTAGGKCAECRMYNFRSRPSRPFRSVLTQPLNVRSGLLTTSFEADVTMPRCPADEAR